MCHPILLGVIAGAIAAKMIFRFRMRRHGGGCGHDGGGGCHGGGGGWGRRWGRHGAFGGGRRQVIHLMNELELNQRQRAEVKEVFQKIHETFGAQRTGRREKLAAMLGAVGGDTFDRAKVEASLQGEGDKFAQLRKEVVDGFEHIHNILTPEQREKLRSLLARGFGGGGFRGPDRDEAQL